MKALNRFQSKAFQIKSSLFYIVFFIPFCLLAQERLVEGVVKDYDSSAPLPRVNVLMKGSTVGTSTDSLGRFRLKVASEFISFSRVGYETVVYPTKVLPAELEIYLKETSTALDEFVVLPGENPAWKLIRALQDNEPKNNPLKFAEFEADFYSKSKVYFLDSITKDRKNLLFLENIGKVYLKNGQRKEEIKYSLQNIPRLIPLDLAFPNNVNPYGFYQPYFRFNPTAIFATETSAVNERNYLNPLKRGTFNAYDYELTDTTYQSGDSLFHIIFQPKLGTTFDAMEGFFEISRSSFALTKFYGRTVDTLLVNRISINQEYQKIDEKWLPASSRVEINYPLLTKKDTALLYFDLLNVFENPSINIKSEVYFDGATKSVLPRADTIKAENFEALRPVKLDSTEFRIYDPEYHILADKPALKKSLESMTGVSKLIYQKGLIAGPLIFSVEPSYTNFHERIRAGIALQNNLTNEPRVDTRGYIVAGLQDQKLKYGLDASYLITKDRYNKIGVYHQKDLLLPGSVNYLGPNYLMEDFPILVFNPKGYRVDDFEKTGVNLYFKPFPFTWLRLFGENEKRSAINYDLEIPGSATRRNYGLQFRFANKEVFNRVGLVEYTINTNFPVVSVNLMQSTSLSDADQSKFVTVSGELKQQIRWKKLGYDIFRLNAGYIDGTVPYSYLFNTLVGERETILGPSTGFQSGDLSNYAANIYFSLIYTHYFGKNLIRSKLKFTQPEPFIRHSYAWGKILNINDYNDVQDFSSGIRELGLGVNALLRIRILGYYASLGCFTSYNYSDTFIGKNRFRIVPTFRIDTF